jgi:hypothetical protein
LHTFDSPEPSTEYNKVFNEMFSRTGAYRYKGDVAAFTSYQFSEVWLRETNFRTNLTDAYFILIDPRNPDSLKQRAMIDLLSKRGLPLDEHLSEEIYDLEADKIKIANKIDFLKQDLYVTLYSLWRTAQSIM